MRNTDRTMNSRHPNAVNIFAHLYLAFVHLYIKYNRMPDNNFEILNEEDRQMSTHRKRRA